MLFRTLFYITMFCEVILKPAFAEENSRVKDSGEWQFLIEPYAWAPDIDVTTSSGDRITIGLDDLVDNLDFAYELLLGARKNKWTIYFDTIIMDLSGESRSTANLVGLPQKTTTSLDIRARLFTLSGSYAVVEADSTRLELLAGIQYYWEELTFEYDIGQFKARASDTFDLWNGIVGVRGYTDLSNDWYLSYHADMGAGDSDFQYQLFGGGKLSI